ncbi:YadA-like family protein [Paraburkholderia metrosideri]|uniref:Chromosome partition protein Smc n=1 Tax=Paraburkholderia metrosideri TaxID=580937 RepID=A0ABM8NKV7_9BURK|nr:YadA-like family protein [Paraburkholderia metrosideri]CAD6530719.1 Chromosome partition protein Smc [Paraburkholderia metrosideri]
MNKSYVSVWNEALGSWVAASENTTARGKRSKSRLSVVATGTLLAIVIGVPTGVSAASLSTPAAATNGKKTANPSAVGNDSTALGAGAVAGSDGSTALGAGATTTGITNWNAAITGNRRTDGLGVDASKLTELGVATAVGTNTSASSYGGTALGNNSTASGTGAVAVGGFNQALGRNSTSVGTGAYSAGLQSQAIGSFSVANNDRANAIGTLATSTGVDATAIGTSAAASGARAIALGSALTTDLTGNLDSLQNTTNNTKASGSDAIAIGTNSNATGSTAVALGLSARATNTNSIAIGNGATANFGGSVALGSGSLTSATAPTGTGFLTNAVAPNSEVSVGSASSTRRITNVSSGSAGTDAVNVSQLIVEDGKVNSQGAATAAALGGGASYNSTTGAISAPSYSVGGTTVGTVSAAITDLDGRTTQNTTNISGLAAGTLGLVKQDAGTKAITMASSTGGTSVDFTGTDGARTLAGVKAGMLSADSTEAVNGSQLYATNTRVSEAEGNITTIDGRVTTAEGNISNIDGRVTNVEGSVTNLSTQLDNGEVGLVKQDAETNAITVASDKAGTSVDFTGTDGARTLSGVKAATLSADSTEAVNGSQLYTTNTRVTEAEGNIAQNTSDIADNRTAISGIDGRMTTAEGNIATIDGRVTTAEGNITTIDGRMTTAEGNISNIDGRVTNVEGSVTNLTQQLGSGELGLVKQDAETNAITVASDKAGMSVDFTGTDGARALSGVKAGTLAADSTEAVNGSQLYATNTRVTEAEGNISQNTSDIADNRTAITNIDGRMTTAEGNITTIDGRMTTAEGNISNIDGRVTTAEGNIGNIDGRVTNVEGSVTNLTQQLGSGELGLVKQDAETNAITVASDKAGMSVDLTGTDGARTLSGVKAATLSADSTEAVNGSQLYATNTRVTEAEGNIAQNTSDIADNRTAISGIDGRMTTAEGNISNIDGRVTTAEGNIGNIDGRVTNVEGSVTNLTQQLGSGELGLVKQDAETNAITVASDKAGMSVDFTGTDGARTLSGVKAATLSADSTEAVNGSQLYATNTRVTEAEGNITNIDGRVTTAEGNISNIDGRVTNVEGSVTNLTQQLGSGELGLVKQDAETNAITVASDKAGMSVDLTGTDGARTLSGVKAATLSADSTEAVNGSQLFTTNTRVTEAEGNIAQNTSDIADNRTAITNIDGRMTTAEGNITTIDSRVTTTEGNITTIDGRVTTAEGNISNIDGRVTNVEGSVTNLTQQLGSGEVGLVKQDAETNAITVASDKAGTSVDFAGTDGARTLSGVKAATLSADSTEAVNGSQLYTTNTRVTEAEGNIAQNASDIADNRTAITNIDGRMTTAEGNITTIDSRVTTTESNISNIDGRVTNVEGSVTNLSTQLTNGEVGLVKQDADSRNITVAKDTDGTLVSLSGTAGNRTVTGVAAGAVNASSVDAINGSQLYYNAASLASALGGGATVNADGTISAPNYSVDGKTVSNMGDAISNIDGRTTQNANQIGALNTVMNGISSGNGIMYFHTNSSQPDSIASGIDSVAIGGGANASAKNSVALGANSVADRADTVSVGASGAERQITNVAAGTADTDAVNVGQLKSAGIVDSNGNVNTAVSYDHNADGSTNYNGMTLGNGVDGGTVIHNVAAGEAPTDAVNMSQLNSVVNNAAAAASNPMFSADGNRDTQAATSSGTSSVAAGASASAAGSQAVAMGANASATAQNSVALGAGSTADRDNSVSVGSTGSERQITNVAAGTAPTDAVNLSQMNNSLSQGVQQANSYTDQRVNATNQAVNDLAKNAYSGIAAATALTMIPEVDVGKKISFGIGASTYHGYQAVALGGTARITENIKVKAGVGMSSGGTTAGIGASYQW